MAKKKTQGGGKQFLSSEKYLQQKARTLEIGTCYVTNDIDKMKRMTNWTTNAQQSTIRQMLQRRGTCL